MTSSAKLLNIHRPVMMIITAHDAHVRLFFSQRLQSVFILVPKTEVQHRIAVTLCAQMKSDLMKRG